MNKINYNYIILITKHMDSTMIYELIHQQINKPKELINLIPTCASLISPSSKITINRMNHQQIFSQVYKTLTSVLNNNSQLKDYILSKIVIDEEGLQQNQDDNDGGQGQEQNAMDVEEAQNEEQYLEEQAGQDDENDGQLQEIDQLGDQEAYDGQEDIGLYGQEIDEEELQSYENQGNSEDDKQFEQEQKMISKKFKKNNKNIEQEQGGQDDLINDQFDHFREIQLQNKEQDITNPVQKNDLQRQIQRLQDKVINKKDWVLKGQIKANQRPVNSLLQYDLQFKTGIKLTQQITPEYNDDLEKIIKQRILDELYDDRARYQHTNVLRQHFSSLKEVSREKSKQGLSELYESQFKNYLGLGQNKHDKLKTEIMESFKEVNYFLDSLSNFHFTPRIKTSNQSQAVIVQEKVPIMGWKGNNTDQPSKIKSKFKSQKEQDNKGKRLKNKRIERQRRKEVTRKKLNKKIQYGGMTKFQAKTIDKRAKNNLNQNKVKYNKSANFFGEMNKDKDKKPNPNINKMKI